MLNPVKYLYSQAGLNPKAIAVQNMDQSLTYGQLLRVVQKAASKFRSFGVKPGQLVMLAISDISWHWTLTLALFHESAVTCSSSRYTLTEDNLGIDWVLSDRPDFIGIPPERLIFIDAAWVKEALSVEPVTEPLEYPDGDSVCRLVLTSGTTGESKAAPFSVETLETRFSSSWYNWTTPGRELNMMPLGTVGGFVTAFLIMAVGGVFYALPKGRSVLEAVNIYKINSLIGSPRQIGAVVQEIKDGKPYDGSVQILRSAGGSLSPLLLKNIQENLCEQVMNIYGSTEVGVICAIFKNKNNAQASYAGFPLPDVQIQIVNQAHEVLPPEQEGTIRAKTPSMVHEYYKDPDGTSRSFKDGWFYPGDRGRLTKNGFLILSGRESELINRGGVKINLEALDRFLHNFSGIQDAAAFSFENKNGIQDIAAAIIASDDYDVKTLQAEMLKTFGRARVPAFFIKVKKIPRNPMGKTMRARLSQELSGMLRDRERQDTLQ